MVGSSEGQRNSRKLAGLSGQHPLSSRMAHTDAQESKQRSQETERLNRELTTEQQYKKAAHRNRKQGEAAKEELRNVAREVGKVLGKPKRL